MQRRGERRVRLRGARPGGLAGRGRAAVGADVHEVRGVVVGQRGGEFARVDQVCRVGVHPFHGGVGVGFRVPGAGVDVGWLGWVGHPDVVGG